MIVKIYRAVETTRLTFFATIFHYTVESLCQNTEPDLSLYMRNN